MASCPRCYTLLPAGASFCPSCGSSIAPTAPLPSRAPAPPPAPTIGATAPSYHAADTPPGTTGPLPPSGFPLLFGESVLRRSENDPRGNARVIRRSSLLALGTVLLIVVPLVVAPFLLSGSAVPIGRLVFPVLFPILLLGAIMAASARSAARRPAVVTTVTTRRVLLENRGRDATSSSRRPENVGNVMIEARAAARSARIAGVSILPVGATVATVGSGRDRRAAPGVIWIPSMAAAEARRAPILQQARRVQEMSGFVAPGPGAPPFPGRAGA